MTVVHVDGVGRDDADRLANTLMAATAGHQDGGQLRLSTREGGDVRGGVRPRGRAVAGAAARHRRLATPVLLLAGGRDVMLDSRESASPLERFVPTATVRLLPEAGHVLPGQTATILDYLRGARRPGR